MGAASGSVDRCLLYTTCIQVLPAFGRSATYVQLIYGFYLYPHAKLHIIPETKKQLLNGLYCPVATIVIFDKIIHKLLQSRCSTEGILLLFSFSSFFSHYLPVNVTYCLPSSGHFCPIHFFFLMLLWALIFLIFGPTSLWYMSAFLILTVCTAVVLKPCIPHVQILYKHVSKRSSRTPRMVYPPQDIFGFWFLTTSLMSDWIKTAVSFWYSDEALLSIFLCFFQAGAKSEGICRSSGSTCRSGPLHGRDQQIAESSKPHRW